LIPLVFAHGAGAIGNRTIGGSALGGMLFGTFIGVLIIPGLYYIFGIMADGRNLIKDETHESLSGSYVRMSEEQIKLLRTLRKVNSRVKQLLGMNKNKNNEK
jgi:HAE1 family hydrophobic/amphiphilic exporter-1